MTESRKVFMENKMAKTRVAVGGAIDSPRNSLFGQKISVHDKNFNQEPENNAKIKPSCRTRFGICPIINISKGFNAFNLSVHFLLFWTGDAKKKKTEPKEEKTAPCLCPTR